MSLLISVIVKSLSMNWAGTRSHDKDRVYWYKWLCSILAYFFVCMLVYLCSHTVHCFLSPAQQSTDWQPSKFSFLYGKGEREGTSVESSNSDVLLDWLLNPLTPRSDSHLTSPSDIWTLSSKQVMGILKLIR